MSAHQLVGEIDALIELLDRRLRDLDLHHARLTELRRQRQRGCTCATCARVSSCCRT